MEKRAASELLQKMRRTRNPELRKLFFQLYVRTRQKCRKKIQDINIVNLDLRNGVLVEIQATLTGITTGYRDENDDWVDVDPEVVERELRMRALFSKKDR